MRRFFSSDFHLGSMDAIYLNQRPFKTVQEMNTVILDECKQLRDDDILVHVGDLAYISKMQEKNPLKLFKNAGINATILNVLGNHDVTNRVKSFCSSFRTCLGKNFTSVSISHYPSYDKHAVGHFQQGDIHICGHVHKSWKHCLDLDNQVLNINVGIDVWGFKLLYEDTLVKYILKLMSMPKEHIIKVRRDKTNGKLCIATN